MTANELKDNLSFNLNGKVAIVTGGTRGIGFSIAQILASHGARVIITGRQEQNVADAIGTFDTYGLKVDGMACHSGDEVQLKKLVDYTAEKYKTVDILVNNAATNPVFGPMEDMDGAVFDKIMQVNVKAGLLLSNFCFPWMQAQGSGSIIHISSVEGSRPSPGLAIYSMSKAALTMLAKSQATEWGKYGIRSNVICPGLVQTKFSSALWKNEPILNEWNDRIPLGRMAQPDEIASLALYLAADASSYTTGAAFNVDGGYLIS
jgi:dehydrogenase/reductase SDR family protein 4